MKRLKTRIDALEGGTRFITLGEMLDHLDGTPLPDGKKIDPSIIAALDALPRD